MQEHIAVDYFNCCLFAVSLPNINIDRVLTEIYPCVDRATTQPATRIPAAAPLHVGKYVPFSQLQAPAVKFLFYYVPAHCLTQC